MLITCISCPVDNVVLLHISLPFYHTGFVLSSPEEETVINDMGQDSSS